MKVILKSELKKGIVCYMFFTLIFLLMLNNICFAESFAKSSDKTVYVYGEMDSSYIGKEVTILLLDKDAVLSNISKTDVKHLEQFTIDASGKYAISFKCGVDIVPTNCKLYARVGMQDVTNTIITADMKKSDFEEYDVSISQNISMSTATVNATNIFNDPEFGIEYITILTFYDENGRLLGVNVGNKNQQVLSASKPDGTKTMKAFVWKETTSIIPLCQPAEATLKEDLKVLIIGNSFSVDGTYYLEKIANAANVNLEIAVAQIGGTSIKDHYERRDLNAFAYLEVDGPRESNLSLDTALKHEDWDYVVMQQWSGIDMGNYDAEPATTAWQPYMNNLAKYIKERVPNTEIALQMTWAFERGYSNMCNGPDYDTQWAKQQIMNDDIITNNTKSSIDIGKTEWIEGKTVSFGGVPIKIIPCGYAMNYARNYTVNDVKIFDTTYDMQLYNECTEYHATYDVGDGYITEDDALAGKKRLNRDGYHASNFGRYLLACVWFETFTGKSVVGNTFATEEITLDSSGNNTYVYLKFNQISPDDVTLLQNIAHQAVANYEIDRINHINNVTE